jgi:hypothetical protein
MDHDDVNRATPPARSPGTAVSIRKDHR